MIGSFLKDPKCPQMLLEDKPVDYSYGPYDKVIGGEQWIRISEGCPNNCPYCYEPTEFKVFGVPDIKTNIVKIIDMNLLAKPEALGILNELGERRVNGHVVRYEFICGIDYRYLTDEIAEALKASRFQNIRIAWDYFYRDQYKIKDAIGCLLKAGYKRKEITVFMICNWRIDFEECEKKLALCKVWNVKVSDCYFDNQLPPKVQPVWWTKKEVVGFRKDVRLHNQLVLFQADVEYMKRSEKELDSGDFHKGVLIDEKGNGVSE